MKQRLEMLKKDYVLKVVSSSFFQAIPPRLLLVLAKAIACKKYNHEISSHIKVCPSEKLRSYLNAL